MKINFEFWLTLTNYPYDTSLLILAVTPGRQNLQMARYSFLHATKFVTFLLFSTNVNDYSLCGDTQLDTKNPEYHQQSMCHVIGSSSLHDSAAPPPEFIPHQMTTIESLMHIPHSKYSYQNHQNLLTCIFSRYYYARSSLHSYLLGDSHCNKMAAFMGQWPQGFMTLQVLYHLEVLYVIMENDCALKLERDMEETSIENYGLHFKWKYWGSQHHHLDLNWGSLNAWPTWCLM